MKPYLFLKLSASLAFVGLEMLFSGCSTLQNSPKYEFVDGWYKTRPTGGKTTRLYVVVAGDSIRAFPPSQIKKGGIDTTRFLSFAFLPVSHQGLTRPYRFTQTTLDLDVLTIPVKYRPSIEDMPNQLNADFNGALYLGYRSDVYLLSYAANPLHLYKRSIAHFGFSAGLFAGIGSTPISPWVTQDQVKAEYSGVVFNKGLAGIFGVNNFTFGLGLGLDHLLDTNHRYWIYQGKPWVGLTIGLNLN